MGCGRGWMGVPMKDNWKYLLTLANTMNTLGVHGSKAVSLTYGAPYILSKKTGVTTKFKNKICAINPDHQFCSVYCILHQEALCNKMMNVRHVC